jgi:hypothetical protein
MKLSINRDDMEQIDRFLETSSRTPNQLHRITMKQLAPVLPMLPEHLDRSLFQMDPLSECSRAVRKMKKANPHIAVYPVDAFSWATLDVGQQEADDNATADMQIEKFINDKMLFLDACGRENVLMHQGKAVPVDMDYAMERDSICSEEVLNGDLSDWWPFWQQCYNMGRKKSVITTVTLLFLMKAIHPELIERKHLTPAMQKIIYYFSKQKYRMDLNTLEMLQAITSFEAQAWPEKPGIEPEFLDKIGTGKLTTAIMYFAATRERSILQNFLNQFPELKTQQMLDATNCDGNTALMTAIQQNREDLVDFLISLNVSIAIENNQKENAFQLAITHPVKGSANTGIIKFMALKIVTLPLSVQETILQNISGGIYNNIARFILVNHPEMFDALMLAAPDKTEWDPDNLELVAINDILKEIEFHKDLAYFKSKASSKDSVLKPFLGIVRNFYQQLEEAKSGLVLSSGPLETRKHDFLNHCKRILNGVDHDFRALPPPSGYSGLLSFIIDVDDVSFRYNTFKSRVHSCCSNTTMTRQPSATYYSPKGI